MEVAVAALDIAISIVLIVEEGSSSAQQIGMQEGGDVQHSHLLRHSNKKLSNINIYLRNSYAVDGETSPPVFSQKSTSFHSNYSMSST